MVFLFILITLYTFNWEPSVGNRVCRGSCVVVSYDINSGVTIGGLGGSLPRAPAYIVTALDINMRTLRPYLLTGISNQGPCVLGTLCSKCPLLHSRPEKLLIVFFLKNI